MSVSTDWQAWIDRWDRQQERYLVDREGRFSALLEAGFREVAEVWRHRNDAVLAAIR